MVEWNTDMEACPRETYKGYLLRTEGGPQIAEWEGGYWFQWLSGEHYGLLIVGKPNAWAELNCT